LLDVLVRDGNNIGEFSAGSAGSQARGVDETKTIPEWIAGVEAALAPRLRRDWLLHAATGALDAIEDGFDIIRSHVQLPERWALRCVVKITVGGGVVTNNFDVTERNVVATGRDPPSGDPKNVLVEGRRGLDVRDADQDANQTTFHVELLTSG
jgi:hypothetical protein